MMFNTSTLLFFTLVLVPSIFVNALCMPCMSSRGVTDGTQDSLFRRDVYSPNITSPSASTKWVVGSKVTVTWDTSNPPKHITNPKGKIILGYETDDSDSEHLNMQHPLAEDFNLTDGQVDVEVPNVAPHGNYFIVLFGDSGNRSPSFTIKKKNQEELKRSSTLIL